MSQEPNLTDANSPEFYKPLPPGVARIDFGHRTPEQMSQDLNVAHDFLRKLVGEKDRLQLADTENKTQIKELKDWQDSHKLWKAFILASAAPVWTILGRALYLFLVRK